MSLSADILLERTRLKSLVRRWRVLFIISLLIILSLVGITSNKEIISSSKEKYVALIELSGIIFENDEQKKRLLELSKDKNVEAVIVYINSPGGTMTGSEIVYRMLTKISETKPVISVIGSIGASGGYMAALAGDKIFSQQSSLTGSIGVMLQSAEVTGLAEKIGVSLRTFKSSPLKGEPSPFSKITPEVEESINSSIEDSYKQFVSMVQESRNLPEEKLKQAIDGRVFTGNQAKELGLIDYFGDENDALYLLKEEDKISRDSKIRKYELIKKMEGIDLLLSIFSGDQNILSSVSYGGMMALWQPSLL